MPQNEKRFLWPNNGKADVHSTFAGKTYRITLLTDRLIRLEFSQNGLFEDRASQHIFFRNLPVPNYLERVDENDTLIVETKYLILTYKKEASFAPDTLSVKLKNAPGTFWHYGDELSTLGGTASTLDGADGAIPLSGGVCSRDGIALFDDSDSLLLGEDGWVEPRAEGTTDLYLFCYGHDYEAAVRDLYRITGAPPMVPDYALGNWWSRYHKYTQDEYEQLMLRFEHEEIPFSVSVVDMDWHIVEIPEDQKDPESPSGWTGYTWNEKFFPDYKAFLRFLGDHNLKTALNLHPGDGCRRHEAQYEEMAKRMGQDPATGERVKFDVLNKDFMAAYFDVLHHPYEKDGVNFWWMDWQQGRDYRWIHEPNQPGEYQDPREKVDPLWMLNHLHILDISRNGKRPMFFSRYAGLGSHRYPVGFSGDTFITWRSLAFQPYFTANAANVGYSWWSHDIGGHMCGYRDDELTVRWMQLGLYAPINRLHSSDNPFSGKEPWNLRAEAATVASDILRTRHQLFPYLYTMNYRNHHDLIPMVRPMYHVYPEQEDAYHVPNQYWFGSELMVAPITEKSDPVDGLAKTEVWFPKGLWYDLYTGMVYEGDQKQEVYRRLAEYPVFAKAGAILPTDNHYADNFLKPREELNVDVFPGADNTFTLYQDEGEGNRFEDGHFATTAMKLAWGEKPVFTIESAEGDLKLIPKRRTYTIRFRALSAQPTVEVRINGRTVKAATTFDAAKHSATVTVAAKTVETVEVELSDLTLYHNEDVDDRAFDILLHAQMDYETKIQVWKNIEGKDKGCWFALPISAPAYEHTLGALRELLALRKRILSGYIL